MKIRDKVDLIGNNIADILEWCRAKRPDCLAHVERLKDEDAFMLLMAIAYQAGRASVIAEVEKTTITEVCESRNAPRPR